MIWATPMLTEFKYLQKRRVLRPGPLFEADA